MLVDNFVRVIASEIVEVANRDIEPKPVWDDTSSLVTVCPREVNLAIDPVGFVHFEIYVLFFESPSAGVLIDDFSEVEVNIGFDVELRFCDLFADIFDADESFESVCDDPFSPPSLHADSSSASHDLVQRGLVKVSLPEVMAEGKLDSGGRGHDFERLFKKHQDWLVSCGRDVKIILENSFN